LTGFDVEMNARQDVPVFHTFDDGAELIASADVQCIAALVSQWFGANSLDLVEKAHH